MQTLLTSSESCADNWGKKEAWISPARPKAFRTPQLHVAELNETFNRRDISDSFILTLDTAYSFTNYVI